MLLLWGLQLFTCLSFTNYDIRIPTFVNKGVWYIGADGFLHFKASGQHLRVMWCSHPLTPPWSNCRLTAACYVMLSSMLTVHRERNLKITCLVEHTVCQHQVIEQKLSRLIYNFVEKDSLEFVIQTNNAYKVVNH